MDISLAILILISMLFAILLSSYFLHRSRLRGVVHESVVSIVLGMAVGLVVRYTADESLKGFLSFEYR